MIIFSNNAAEHEKHVETALEKIRAAGLSFKKKYKFFQSEIEFICYIISKGKVRVDSEKILAIQEHTKPDNISDLRSFLSLCNTAREFVPRFADIELPLTELLKGEKKRSKKKLIGLR
ncbi:retrotransposon ty3-gypsy subclass [Pseudoloma neurophilia]|uniref:Retrotransposon ty3-gypsy subclass n=1 Tax=Pseudoloma neurophilia TaxID=146866 RepID=A0A0R0LWW0_9MICR|nr:retrotransposon ty3-gypsy subclass [Pseudoloma neurophilia]